MRTWFIIFTLVLGVMLSAFIVRTGDDPVPIPPSPQRTGGDVQKGYDYLINGDYIRSGIPYAVYLFGAGADKNNYLKREGINKNVTHEMTAIKAANGEVVVAPNCLNCHAQVFDNQLIVGLGNSLVDFTPNKKFNIANIELLEKLLKAKSPRQYEASYEFIRASKAITEQLVCTCKRRECSRPVSSFISSAPGTVIVYLEQRNPVKHP